ncbi:MAG: AbrB/MazE/SpoVT family DNA-binding domain-containing protein [Actinobacteria bacterium]|nr:AbrB/MazE/SpoVT family DNA-binding domain-containing protein [Actinomycetota bacterium]
MKNTGVSRKIDDLGRLVLPAEIRRHFGLSEGTHVDISVQDNQIVLRKVEDACLFCGSADDLRSFRDRPVCGDCLRQLNATAEPSA